MSEDKRTGEPRIVAAANRSREDNLIVVGARHYDATMKAQIQAAGGDANTFQEQGFIDQFGQFYNREEAWQIALRNNQIRFRCGGDTDNGGTLYSENLY